MPVDELRTAFAVVEDFPDYRVGDDGRVWSRLRNSRGASEVDGWHEVKGKLDKDGYRSVILCARGRRWYVRVAVLVLRAFIGPPPSGMTAAHGNGVRTDNRLDNLSWKTQQDNVADKKRHGTHQAGERHGMAKMTEAVVLDIRRRRAAGEKLRDIARDVGRPVATIHAAAVGRLWKHLPL